MGFKIGEVVFCKKRLIQVIRPDEEKVGTFSLSNHVDGRDCQDDLKGRVDIGICVFCRRETLEDAAGDDSRRNGMLQMWYGGTSVHLIWEKRGVEEKVLGQDLLKDIGKGEAIKLLLLCDI